MPGETLANVRIDFASFEPNFVGRNFVLLEGGKTIAEGQITELCERTAELSVESVTKEAGSSVIYLVLRIKTKNLGRVFRLFPKKTSHYCNKPNILNYL